MFSSVSQSVPSMGNVIHMTSCSLFLLNSWRWSERPLSSALRNSARRQRKQRKFCRDFMFLLLSREKFGWICMEIVFHKTRVNEDEGCQSLIYVPPKTKRLEIGRFCQNELFTRPILFCDDSFTCDVYSSPCVHLGINLIISRRQKL